MTATQGVVPVATAVPLPGSRARTAAVIALAVLAALTLAAFFGARVPGDGSGRSFAPYDWSRSGSAVVDENRPYPATGNLGLTR